MDSETFEVKSSVLTSGRLEFLQSKSSWVAPAVSDSDLPSEYGAANETVRQVWHQNNTTELKKHAPKAVHLCMFLYYQIQDVQRDKDF